MPTSENEKKENGPSPDSAAASETITFTGLLISISSPPALPANATGMSSCDGGVPIRWPSSTTSGSSAATAPLRVIRDVSNADNRQIAIRTRVRSVPARSISQRPAQVVTPVESMPSLTTNRVAMKMTTGSPKPPTACSAVTSPVAQRVRAARMATLPTGSLFHMNRATTRPSTISALVASSIARDGPGRPDPTGCRSGTRR